MKDKETKKERKRKQQQQREKKTSRGCEKFLSGALFSIIPSLSLLFFVRERFFLPP